MATGKKPWVLNNWLYLLGYYYYIINTYWCEVITPRAGVARVPRGHSHGLSRPVLTTWRQWTAAGARCAAHVSKFSMYINEAY